MFSKFKYKKLYDVKSPIRSTRYSGGIDFYIPDGTEEYIRLLGDKVLKVMVRDTQGNEHEQNKICVPAFGKVLLPSGLKVSYPKNMALDFLNKSGIASRDSLLVGAELCDWDYQQELFFDLHNVSDKDVYLDFGQKIVQGFLLPVYYLKLKEVYDDNKLFGKRPVTRTGGFGSTGIR